MEEILTAEQVAHMLKIHVRTVYRLARSGGIPGRKLGGGWRFSKDLILQFLSYPVQHSKTLEERAVQYGP